MDGPRDYHTKPSKSERERQTPYDITYMWNLKQDTNEPINKTDSQIRRTDLWLLRGEKYWEFGISKYKLLYREWINKKVLLCSTKNYMQYPVINSKEKNMKQYIYV